MAFRCPDCRALSLDITGCLDFPGDASSDEISLQRIRCGSCGFAGVAVYEESRRGSMDSESWHHQGHRLVPGALDVVTAAIDGCPTPRDERCACGSHQMLGRLDPAGRWQGLDAMWVIDSFPMENR